MSTTNEGAEGKPAPLAEKPLAGALAEVEIQRAVAEIQASLIIAQRFPRNEADAVNRIMNAFTRPELCEKGMYEYARGGESITGLSIRASEAIAQQWGNVKFGVRELEQGNGVSTVQAYAWDLQTNVQEERTFQVPHIRERSAQRGGRIRLEDSRYIYELVANLGARRLRACILAIIPVDVQRRVERQIETTLRTKVEITKESLQEMLDTFAEFGVTRQQIEKVIQRSLESITPAQVLRFKRIYMSIRDGIGSVGDYFEIEAPKPGENGGDRVDELSERLRKKAEKQGETPPPKPVVVDKNCTLCPAKKGQPHAPTCPVPKEDEGGAE